MTLFLTCDADSLDVAPHDEIILDSSVFGRQRVEDFARSRVQGVVDAYGNLAGNPDEEEAARKIFHDVTVQQAQRVPLLIKGTTGAFRYAFMTAHQVVFLLQDRIVDIRTGGRNTDGATENPILETWKSLTEEGVSSILDFKRLIPKRPVIDKAVEGKLVVMLRRELYRLGSRPENSEPELSHTTLNSLTHRVNSRAHSPYVPHEMSGEIFLEPIAPDRVAGSRKFTKAAYAMRMMAGKAGLAIARGSAIPGRMMLDSGAHALAARACGHGSVAAAYKWLACPEEKLRQARHQFSSLYPELVAGVSVFRELADLPDGQEVKASRILQNLHLAVESHSAYLRLHDAIDEGKPVAPIVRELLPYDKWVHRKLRGRMTYTGVINQVDAHIGGIINRDESHGPVSKRVSTMYRGLQKLGPEWDVKNDDMARAFSFIMEFGMTEREARSAHGFAAPLLPLDQWGATLRMLPRRISPWKELETAFLEAGVPKPVIRTRATFANDAASYVRDMVRALRRDVIDPMNVMANIARLEVMRGVRPEDIDFEAAYRTWGNPEEARVPFLPPVEFREFMGVSTLQKYATTSVTWHRQMDFINAAKELGRLERIAEGGENVSMAAWGALVPDVAFAGVNFASITTARDLKTHGRMMQHCVGTYDTPCLAGASHIVSMESEDGSLSTAEIGVDTENWRLVVKQHRAQRNGEPSQLHRDALKDMVVRLNRHLHQAQDREPEPLFRISRQKLLGLKAAGDNRRPYLASYRNNEWNWRDPIAMDAMLNAYRFAMDNRMRLAWDKGATPHVRVFNACRWVSERQARQARLLEVQEMTDEPGVRPGMVA